MLDCKSRATLAAEVVVFSRPFGTYLAGRAHPALKRWAILGCPSGTGGEPRLSKGGYCSKSRVAGSDRMANRARQTADGGWRHKLS